ncbi:hypothetical protein, partial [Bradyrhizobium sp. S69]|uniref:hypothetical protein n=1 Tax=Bradyrhizobium sp. S69 TaxID=1641856 RepID=UPI001AEDDBA2
LIQNKAKKDKQEQERTSISEKLRIGREARPVPHRRNKALLALFPGAGDIRKQDRQQGSTRWDGLTARLR